MEIYFLSPKHAHLVLHDLHISKECTKAHNGNIIGFNNSQKKLLISLMRKLETLASPYLLEIQGIEFILLRKGVYYDFPFTWGTSLIIMSEAMFDRKPIEILKILAHELVHLEQRRDPAKYDKYYKTMGFKKLAEIDFGTLEPYLLKNPDATKYNWIWHNRYVPLALCYDCKFHVLLMDYKTKELHKVESVESYYNHFGTKGQLYHPNEIVAHLVADLIVDARQHVCDGVNYDLLRRLLHKKDNANSSSLSTLSRRN